MNNKLENIYGKHIMTENSVITQINNNLFLGSSDSNNIDVINQYDISLIISLLSRDEQYELNLIETHSTNVINLIYTIEDDPSDVDTMKSHLNAMYPYIFQCLNGNKKVLIHCSAGYSRSPTGVMYVLMRFYGMSLGKAQQLILSKRCIEPNFGFWMLLVKCEKNGFIN
jgi:protein-tyrosine phosphatase